MHKILHFARHHVTHFSKKSSLLLSRRRNKFIAVLFIINIIFIIQIMTNQLTFPNTSSGKVSIGLSSKAKLQQTLNSLMRTKHVFDIHGKMYEYSYEDLGVYLDTEATIKNVRLVNSRPFPFNQLTFLASFFLSRDVAPELHFSEQYHEFVENTIYDSSRGDDIVYLDQSNKKLGMIEQTERFTLDPYTLQIILTESFGYTEKPIVAPLIPASNLVKQSVELANAKLESSYEDPLTLIIGTQDNHKFFRLSQEVLQDISIASVSADKTAVEFVIDREKLLSHVSSLWPMIGKLSPDPVITDRISKNLALALSHRATGIVADSFSVPLDGGPNSDGNIADRYIEVDISQQKLYTFLHGKMIKTYRVSTGKDYPTPVGSFEILNKTGLGFSNIYNVWMPWWMGFNYSKELHAYFGIHELPYVLKEGNKIQRPKDFIGVPNTGGCVALGVGEAREVYQFADIGTKVVIYE